jgi:RNA-directed DNA polymerase
MKESYGEGVASHTDPKSCGGGSNATAEALIGARAGGVLSREIPSSGCRHCPTGGRQDQTSRERETRVDPARSETSSTYGNTMHGNREIPGLPRGEGHRGRIGKLEGARR